MAEIALVEVCGAFLALEVCRTCITHVGLTESHKSWRRPYCLKVQKKHICIIVIRILAMVRIVKVKILIILIDTNSKNYEIRPEPSSLGSPCCIVPCWNPKA